jgi:hypothetical protein
MLLLLLLIALPALAPVGLPRPQRLHAAAVAAPDVELTQHLALVVAQRHRACRTGQQQRRAQPACI